MEEINHIILEENLFEDNIKQLVKKYIKCSYNTEKGIWISYPSSCYEKEIFDSVIKIMHAEQMEVIRIDLKNSLAVYCDELTDKLHSAVTCIDRSDGPLLNCEAAVSLEQKVEILHRQLSYASGASDICVIIHIPKWICGAIHIRLYDYLQTILGIFTKINNKHHRKSLYWGIISSYESDTLIDELEELKKDELFCKLYDFFQLKIDIHSVLKDILCQDALAWKDKKYFKSIILDLCHDKLTRNLIFMCIEEGIVDEICNKEIITEHELYSYAKRIAMSYGCDYKIIQKVVVYWKLALKNDRVIERQNAYHNFEIRKKEVQHKADIEWKRRLVEFIMVEEEKIFCIIKKYRIFYENEYLTDSFMFWNNIKEPLPLEPQIHFYVLQDKNDISYIDKCNVGQCIKVFLILNEEEINVIKEEYEFNLTLRSCYIRFFSKRLHDSMAYSHHRKYMQMIDMLPDIEKRAFIVANGHKCSMKKTFANRFKEAIEVVSNQIN